LVYVGAVNVLILFAIMLVNKREDFKPMKNAWIRQGTTAIVCAGIFALLSTVSLITPWKISTLTTPMASSIVPIAKHFFTDFLLPFELASLLLLMSMVGAIILARRDFLPDNISGVTSTQDSLTLPERPRELAGVDK
jgi:NAD(P)H-quinone oxidoreductase subunit 6